MANGKKYTNFNRSSHAKIYENSFSLQKYRNLEINLLDNIHFCAVSIYNIYFRQIKKLNALNVGN